MNQIAKELREAADYMKREGVDLLGAVIRLNNTFDAINPGTPAANLGAIVAYIADELDELDDKATRRRSHIVKLESTIAERNRELRELRKQVPTERERRILDMWPRFEDSEYVWFGDEVACRGKACMLDDVKFVSDGTFHDETYLYVSNGLDVFEVPIAAGERVKRPVQSVLDADGVETRSGDTVYLLKDGDKCRVTGFETIDGEVFARLRCDDRPEIEGARGSAITHRRRVLDADGVEIGVGDTVYEPNGKRGTVVRVHPQTGCVDLSQGDCDAYCMDAESLTHTPPDSWKRLAEDAAKHPCVYAEGVKGGKFSKCSECPWGNECDGSRAGEMMARDIIRRAKALAGIGAGE